MQYKKGRNMKMYSMAILAGGLAKRLEPITSVIPKSLVKINGKPFIDIQLELLKKNKFSHVVLCVGHGGDMIRDHVGNGHQFNLDVEYSFDGKKLLGTAGAIKKALKFLDDNFFIMYGDSYLDTNYAKVQKKFKRSRKNVLMTIYKNSYFKTHEFNNVSFKRGKILNYRKQTITDILRVGLDHTLQYIDYGLSIFNKKAFAGRVEGRFYDLDSIFYSALWRKQLAALEIKSRFYEIGSFQGLNELREVLS